MPMASSPPSVTRAAASSLLGVGGPRRGSAEARRRRRTDQSLRVRGGHSLTGRGPAGRAGSGRTGSVVDRRRIAPPAIERRTARSIFSRPARTAEAMADRETTQTYVLLRRSGTRLAPCQSSRTLARISSRESGFAGRARRRQHCSSASAFSSRSRLFLQASSFRSTPSASSGGMPRPST